MNKTTNYQLPIYAESDPADLINGYNVAVTAIDSQMKKNETAASAFVKSSTDKTVTVEQLASLKATASGIVYIA